MRRPRLQFTAARGATRLHRDERGVIFMVFLFVSILLGLAIGVMWNTGRVISAKMRAQLAADAAAYAAATWTSRAVNLVALTNMLILRNASAHVSAVAVNAVCQEVPVRWQAALDAADPLDLPVIQARIAAEEAEYNRLALDCWPLALDALNTNRFLDRIADLHAFQRSFVEGVPDAVNAQRAAMEEFFGVEIHLAVPGRDDGLIVPPVRLGTPDVFEHMLTARRLITDRFRPQDQTFRDIDLHRFNEIGGAVQIWNAAVAQAIAGLAASIGDRHYVLASQVGLDELSPSEADRAPFTVFAAAVDRSITQGANFLFARFFDYPVNNLDAAISCAQAETYNGIEALMTMRNVDPPHPFRVWTTRGCAWQPRLTRCDLVEQVLTTDPAIRAIFVQSGITDVHHGRVLFALQH